MTSRDILEVSIALAVLLALGLWGQSIHGLSGTLLAAVLASGAVMGTASFFYVHRHGVFGYWLMILFLVVPLALWGRYLSAAGGFYTLAFLATVGLLSLPLKPEVQAVEGPGSSQLGRYIVDLVRSDPTPPRKVSTRRVLSASYGAEQHRLATGMGFVFVCLGTLTLFYAVRQGQTVLALAAAGPMLALGAAGMGYAAVRGLVAARVLRDGVLAQAVVIRIADRGRERRGAAEVESAGGHRTYRFRLREAWARSLVEGTRCGALMDPEGREVFAWLDSDDQPTAATPTLDDGER